MEPLAITVTIIALNLTLHCNYYTCKQEAIRIEQGDTVTYTVDASIIN